MFSPDFLKSLNVVDWGYTEDSTPITFNDYIKWINAKSYGPLEYLADDRANIRKDLKLYYPEFQSAIVFVFSYQSSSQFLNEFYQSAESNGLKIASYTLGFEGLDYHLVLKERLEKILSYLIERNKNLTGKIALDIHPVLDRDLALKSGLGFFGKNSMLINTQAGSFTIIGSILLSQKLELKTKAMDVDHCGQCTRCIDACPTDAITPGERTINASRCISTFTIEQFKLDTIPSEKLTLSSGYIFGCDICQDVCPWNKRLLRFPKNSIVELNQEQQKLVSFFLKESPSLILEKLKQMSNKEFRDTFFKTSFFRSGKRGIIKNLLFYLKIKA